MKATLAFIIGFFLTVCCINLWKVLYPHGKMSAYTPGNYVQLVSGEKGVIQNIDIRRGYEGAKTYYIRLAGVERINPNDSYDLSIRIYDFEIAGLIQGN